MREKQHIESCLTFPMKQILPMGYTNCGGCCLTHSSSWQRIAKSYSISSQQSSHYRHTPASLGLILVALAICGVTFSRLHLHGRGSWEKENSADARKVELHRHFEAIGRAEARIFFRRIGDIPADRGIHLVCSRRAGLDVLQL
jgi:hypothetical protein